MKRVKSRTKKSAEPSGEELRRARYRTEDEEEARLAPWAQRASESAGRKHREPPHPFRTAFERDRARIVHSRAFRRLEFKTQVFLSGSGDHLRNRLTHTIEVALISRTVSRALGLNEDLAEAIALAHDLGHAPFGHSGEEVLGRLMIEHGGFDHNAQSIRVVELLEEKYPAFPGLNLSYEVIEGLRKHQRFHVRPSPGGGRHPSPSLEAQVANLADEITYYSHDLDDGLEFSLLEPRWLDRVTLWAETKEAVKRDFPRLKGDRLYRYMIRCLIDREVEDLVETSRRAIAESGVRSVEEVRRHPEPLIRYSEGLRERNIELRRFLYEHLYYHPEVAGANRRACELLQNVFTACVRRPSMLGRSAAARIRKEGLERTVCDYLSGMTDRYLIEEHERIFGHGREHARPVRRPE